MSFTRLQIQTRVLQNLNDATSIYFDTAMVQSSIQDMYDKIVLNSQCLEALINVNFVNTQLYYDLYDNIFNPGTTPGYWRPTRLFNYETNRWIRCVDSIFLDKYRFDWEVSSGTPWFAYIVNHQFLSFFPHYITTAGTSNFDIYYKVAQDVLSSDSQVIQIPPPYTRCLENAATADLLESVKEFKKAAVYWKDYNEQLEAFKIHIAGRMDPDFYKQLNDLDFPYPGLP